MQILARPGGRSARSRPPSWTASRCAQAVPNDLQINQWGLDNTGQVVNGLVDVFDADLDAPEAWELTTGDKSIVVAVLDSGVHADHPDLEANLAGGVRRPEP